MTAWIKRIFAPVVATGAVAAKYGAVLIKLKSVVFLGSLAVSIAAYASLYGWKFGVGLAALILVHELGHVVALRLRGIRAGALVFVPLLGAFTSWRSVQRSPYLDAETALAGPLAGTAGALAMGYVAHLTGSDLLRSLAFTGLLLNLFNLVPALPLDGGRVAGAVHPAVWVFGWLTVLGIEIYRPNPILAIVLLFGGHELYQQWRRPDRTTAPNPGLVLTERRRISTAYAVLAVVILLGMHATYAQRHLG
jgi:Zn-dependent protease